MTRYLVRTHNIRMSYHNREILLFDDDAAGAFRHVKLHPQVAAAHSYSVGQTLYVHIGTVFGANVGPHDWEVSAQARCKLAENLQSSPNLEQIIHKHKELTDLISLPLDTDKHPNLLVQVTSACLCPGVFIDKLRVLTQNAMFVDHNLLANVQEELTPAIPTSAESFFILLGDDS